MDTITKAHRAGLTRQKPFLLWLTGLSGAGKSTLANALEQTLFALGHHTYLLDGDHMRRGLNSDLGFDSASRAENIRRVAEVAKLMLDAGMIVIVACISPFRADRDKVRAMFAAGEFVELYLDTALAVCEQRDPKGLYAKARRGEISDFTGIDSPYEPPLLPEIRINGAALAVAEERDLMVDYLRQHGYVAVPAR